MLRRLKTFLWFLRKPRYIPQIFQVLKRKKNDVLENTREEASLWCKENCISQKTAFKKLFHIETFENLSDLFPNEIKDAKKATDNCPFTMGGEGAISFLYHVTKQSKSKRIIETGVAYGWSSLAILLAIKDIPNAKLISIDMPYIKMENDKYVGCAVSKKLKDKWVLIWKPDVQGIPKALKLFGGVIDLCHYDSDKSYTGRMGAYPLLWDALSDKGFFITDDIQDNIAFKLFCGTVKRKPIIIEHKSKYVGILIK